MQSRTILITIAFTATLFSVAFSTTFQFEECTDRYGLTPLLQGIMSHAAACGDVDNDGDLDLYVGNFCDRPPDQYLGRSGPVSNMLLINQDNKYSDSEQNLLAIKARTSGAAFVDLDNDGDIDLYVSNNSKSKGLRVPNSLYENRNGRFHEISGKNDACVIMGGRSIGVLDYNGDGLLDLLVAEDQWTGRRTRLIKNLGNFRFEDVSSRAGLPDDLAGLGVITPDLNEDGWPDIFVSQANKLFLSNADSTYRQVVSKVFQYVPINNEATPCGVTFADLNLDGLMDIVLVDHSQPARLHLYINKGLQNGIPQFIDATKQAHLDYLFPSWTPEKLHLKHAHVECADFDCDGWPDIFVAATWKKADQSLPLICHNITQQKTDAQKNATLIPIFEVPPIGKAAAYYPAGPVADYNRDGRPDIFLASWFPQIGSKLFLNRNKTNHWLNVQVVGKKINRMAIGTKVKVYTAGAVGDKKALIGFCEIGIGYGFCSSQEAIASFGLGTNPACDVEIILPFGKGTIRKSHVKADRLLVVHD